MFILCFPLDSFQLFSVSPKTRGHYVILSAILLLQLHFNSSPSMQDAHFVPVS